MSVLSQKQEDKAGRLVKRAQAPLTKAKKTRTILTTQLTKLQAKLQAKQGGEHKTALTIACSGLLACKIVTCGHASPYVQACTLAIAGFQAFFLSNTVSSCPSLPADLSSFRVPGSSTTM